MEIISYQAQNFVGSHPPVMQLSTFASTGAEKDLVAGTVLGKVTAAGKLVPLAPGASDGSESAVGILVEDSVIPAAGDAVANIYVHGDFRKDGLVWPDGITAEQKTAAVNQLAALGLFVK